MRPAGLKGIRGYTIVEVIVAMVLTGLVVAGTLRALTAQKRFYSRQARILDARHAMRAAATILSAELREVSAANGDLYNFGSDSVSIRSTAAFGVVCSVGAASLSLRHISGHFVRQDNRDSLLVFVENAVDDDSDDAWQVYGVASVTLTGDACYDGASADRVVSTDAGVAAGVRVGAPVRLFRPYIYALFQESDGRWWLGRKLRDDPDFVPVAGPLAPPVDNGLILTYMNDLGAPTAVAAEVRRIGITIRAPTNRTLSDPAYTDLRTSAYLRNRS